jgi:hypothetical protein
MRELASITRNAFAAVLLCLSAGCANLATLGRTTLLPLEGRALHLEPAQRLAYTDSVGRICVEPALLGAATNPAGAGPRPQSTAVLRDMFYRICEAAHNGMLTKGDLVQLLERAQDVTLGLLAIERLNGAVAGTADRDVIVHLAETTKSIVATIVLKNRLTDACISTLAHYAAESDPLKREAVKPVFAQCQAVIQAAQARHGESLAPGAALPQSGSK